jgi:hypothetical protein
MENLAMPLTSEQREYILSTAVEILRHPKRDKLLRIVEDRIRRDDYPDDHERELDRVVFALSQTISVELLADS